MKPSLRRFMVLRRTPVLLISALLLTGTPMTGDAVQRQSGPTGGGPPLREAAAASDDQTCSTDDASRMEEEDEALAHDMAKVAENEGWTCEEAEGRLRHQDDFAVLAADMQKRHPETFAGAKQVDGPEATRYVMRFVDAVPEDARAEAEEAGIDVTFEDDAHASEAELKRRSDEIVEDMRDTRFPSYVIGPRTVDGVISGHVTRPREDRDQDGRSDDELREELPESARADDVSIRFVDEPMRATQASDRVIGGGEMQSTQHAGLCTSGFVVSHESITRGVTTAAHCDPSYDLYRNPENLNVYEAPMQGRCWDACREDFGDFQWHETSEPHTGDFYWNHDNDTRRVIKVASQGRFGAGQRYCGFGRNTDSEPDCADVVDPDSTCVDENGNEYGRMVVMGDDFPMRGDSGGPWFWGRLAAGTQTIVGDGISCFARAGLVVNTPMGVDVVARDRKVRGERMPSGDRIWSPNADYELWMQETDGNLVLYGPDGPEWASGTDTGERNRAIMQGDGNFVIYSPGGDPLWATGTSQEGNKIMVQNDGNLVVYDPDEVPRWACCS